MRRIDWFILAAGLTAAIGWALISGREGFKGSNAVIVARSISITSTIDGQVENNPPDVGTRVNPDDLLVRIHNGRIDRGRQVEFVSEIEFLQHEIDGANLQQQQLDELLRFYEEKANAHREWMLGDVELRIQENRQFLEISQGHEKLKADSAQRTASLFGNSHTSEAAMDAARVEAEIASGQVDLSRTRLARDELLHTALQKNGMFFDNGDASYWDRMVDSLTLRHLDNLSRISTLDAQLARVRAQANVEHSRIGSSVTEDHHSPFSGMVNATYVAKGTRVTTGTSLLQVLDCTDPVVIVPLPEHRIGEFDVGMSATIYPVDSDIVLSGTVEYISSGPLIGNDQTLFVQEQLTMSGVHAVVGFTDTNAYRDTAQSCESAHRAVVIIHTQSSVFSNHRFLARN